MAYENEVFALPVLPGRFVLRLFLDFDAFHVIVFVEKRPES